MIPRTECRMTADDWRAHITALTGGDTIETMLAWTARQDGWTAKVGWVGISRSFDASVYRADRRQMTEREHPTDPAKALARALLAAVAAGGRR